MSFSYAVRLPSLEIFLCLLFRFEETEPPLLVPGQRFLSNGPAPALQVTIYPPEASKEMETEWMAPGAEAEHKAQLQQKFLLQKKL